MADAELEASWSREERVDRAILEYLEAADAGQVVDRAEFLARHSDVAPELEAYFADHEQLDDLTTPLRNAGSADAGNDVPSSPNTDTLPGTIGGYRPVRLIGAGGMGRVYEARDRSGREVALKLIAPRFAGSPSALQRFRQEGRLASQIAHPRSVFVIAADEELNQPYIVMELMSGETLKHLVERDGPLDPVDAIGRIFDVIEGLEQAHALGVIHRDVKPANCYIDRDGRVKIGDFGLARSLAAGSAMTQVGGFIGTPLFAAPEQLKGERLDERADVYSVAATLYYLVTGRAPFGDAQGAAAIARIASEAPIPPRQLREEIPPALERVILKGMERSKTRRYATLSDLREALQPFLPRELTIAGLGLRLGAVFVDALPFWVAAALADLSGERLGRHVGLSTLLALQVPFFLYFWLLDGTLGATPGKWLLGLRVTRADNRAGPPGLWRALLRTAVFLATGGFLSDLIITSLVAPSDRVRWLVLSVIGYAVSLTARFSTMRASNGYQALHERASGTRVVQRPVFPKRRRFAELSGLRAPLATIHREGLPVRLGRFVIRGAVRWDDDAQIVEGEDASLGRRAWIRIRAAHEDLVPPVRRELARTTRLRWLGSAEHGPWIWDAFVAPTGRPLSELVAHGTLGWGATRHILEQLTEELTTSRTDGTRPSGLSVAQVWVRESGDVEVIDVAPGPNVDRAVDGPSAADAEDLKLVREVATLALTGRTERIQGPRAQIRAIVPLHARRLLEQLVMAESSDQRLSEWRAGLIAIHSRPAECTTAQRALQIALSAVSLFFVVFGYMSWSRIAAAAAIAATDRSRVTAAALLDVLDDDELRSDLYSSLPEDSLLRTDPAEARRLLQLRQAQDRRELAVRVQSLGPMRSMRVFRQFLDDKRPTKIERIPGDGFAIRVRYPLEPIPLELELRAWDATILLRRAAEGEPSEFSRARIFVWTLISLPLFTLVIIALIARGGLTLRMAGLALVRADGQGASRPRAAWRAITMLVPFLALVWWVVVLDTGTVDHLSLVPVPFILAGLLLVAGAGMALWFPRRTIHDWLAGTYVVPR